MRQWMWWAAALVVALFLYRHHMSTVNALDGGRTSTFGLNF